jgi:hypothetical protein
MDGFTSAIIMVAIILALHFVGDFVIQTDKMARNKSSSMAWLSYHVAMYSIGFFIFFGWKYALVNYVLHWITDFCSSKISSKYYKAGKIHEFFVVIGADQMIHMFCLFATLKLAGW